jgi:hypothetical protein
MNFSYYWRSRLNNFDINQTLKYLYFGSIGSIPLDLTSTSHINKSSCCVVMMWPLHLSCRIWLLLHVPSGNALKHCPRRSHSESHSQIFPDIMFLRSTCLWSIKLNNVINTIIVQSLMENTLLFNFLLLMIDV